jgi:TolA-binding protein
MSRNTVWLLAGALALSCTAAGAQAPPAQNANIYNGLEHQPAAGATAQQEQAAGIAPPQQQQQQQANTIEQLNSQLQQIARTPLAARAGCSADGKVCPP